MTLKSKNIFAFLPFIIIAIGAILRLWGFSEWSLHNDELSTLFRASFSTIDEVIQKGVITDVHPAFSEIFIHYWIELFGNSPFSLRLPYVLSSILGLFYFYRLAKLWINEKAAILALSVISFSYLFVLYGQIARPYAIGFLIITAFSFYWFSWWFGKKSPSNIIFSILFGTIGLYTHYFLGLSIALVIASSLFFIPNTKKDWAFLILAPLAMGTLFLPHIEITLGHLSQKGVGWLPMPEDDFLIDFIYFSFNKSWLWISLILITPLTLLFWKNEKQLELKKLALLFLFLIPYGIGHYYSLKVSPVLQYSVLIYALPFLLLFLMSFFNRSTPLKWFYVILATVSIGGSYTLIANTKIYEKKPFANFKEISYFMAKWNNDFKDKILFITNTNNANYLNYYFDINSIGKPNIEIVQFTKREDHIKVQEILEDNKVRYVALGFANVPIPREVHELIKQKFPTTVEQHRYFNSEAILYGNEQKEREKTLSINWQFANESNWKINKIHLSDSIFFSSPNSYKIEVNEEYSLTFKGTVDELFNKEANQYLTISSKIYKPDPSDCNIKLVTAIDRDGENIYWRANEIDQYIRYDNWDSFAVVLEKKKDFRPNDKIAIYFWNPKKSSIYVDDLEFNIFVDSDYNYYDF